MNTSDSARGYRTETFVVHGKRNRLRTAAQRMAISMMAIGAIFKVEIGPGVVAGQSVGGTAISSTAATATATSNTAAGGTPEAGTAGGSGPAASAPAGSQPAGSSHRMTPEQIKQMRQMFENAQNDPRFQPETAESLQRKLQSGEYKFEEDSGTTFRLIWRGGLLIFCVVMFIVTLVRNLAAKNSKAGPAQEEVRHANALAVNAAAQYKNLVGKVNRANFVERRSDLAAEGEAAESVFRQSAERFRAAADKFLQAAEGEKASGQAQLRAIAGAYADRAASQNAMADVMALLGDASVTSAEEFSHRAAPLLVTAKTANENCGRVMKGAKG